MNRELIAEVLSDSPDPVPAAGERLEAVIQEQESPYYVVPQPPVPGQTAWSMVPW